VLAPAAALACGAFATVWHARAGRQVASIAHPTMPYSGSAASTPRPARPRGARPVVGLVIMGELQRRHPGTTLWEPVDSGSKIELDDTLSTGPDASASIVFMDTSVSRLSPNSTVQYTGPGRGPAPRPSRVRLARGETWSVVEKGGPPFVVETQTAQAVVHGAEFGVGVDAHERTTLQVKEGQVALQAGGATVMVGMGMQALVLPGHPPLPPVPMASVPRTRPTARHPAKHPVVPPASIPSEAPAGGSSDRIIQRAPPPGNPAPADAPGGGSGTDDSAPSRPFDTSR
jgi:ferric-dicitrate binding protein FerR (iron transport regulator)